MSRLKQGASLFRIALELDEDTCRAIKDYPHFDCIPVARLAVWFVDFFNKSDGWDFSKCSWPERFPAGKRPQDIWGDALKRMGHDYLPCDRTSFLSKCWCLDTRTEETGFHSKIWNCIRKAKHSFLADGEIRVEGEDAKESSWIRLLMATDTIERREFSQLVEWLATGEVPEDLRGHSTEPSWEAIHDACLYRVGAEAWVDWYLRLPDDGVAQFGVGFDCFPSKQTNQEWRSFEVDGIKGQKIENDYAWFAPVPLKHEVEVKYCKHRWGTCNSQEKEDPRNRKDSVLFPRRDIPFGVFLRHRITDIRRRNWWREADKWWNPDNTPPELKRNQHDILICARDEGSLQDLGWCCDNPALEMAVVHEELQQRFEGRQDDGEVENHPIRVYRITRRPPNEDVPLKFLYKGEEFGTITILGAIPTICIEGNPDQVETLPSDNRIVVFPGQALRLRVDNARPHQGYNWNFTLDGQSVWNGLGNDLNVLLRDAFPQVDFKDHTLHHLRISCRDNDGGMIKSDTTGAAVSGIVLPDGVRRGLLSGSPCPANWTATEVVAPTAIPDWIDGKRRIHLVHQGDAPLDIREPIAGDSPYWWFELGQQNYHEKNGLKDFKGQSVFTKGNAPAIDDESLKYLYLCLPAHCGSPAGDNRTWYLSEEGYWRGNLRKLTEAGKGYRYTPNAEVREWQHQGITFFRYLQRGPGNATFCLDLKGHLGLYVPESEQSIYEIYVFSDQSPDLLLTGTKLGETRPGIRFLDIDSAWQDFCKRTNGYDAVLSAFPHMEGVTQLFYAALGCDPACCLLRQDSQSAVPIYPAEMMPVLPTLKAVGFQLTATEHPVRRMHIFTTPQTATSEEIRAGWKNTVESLCQTQVCTQVSSWMELFRTWLASGFQPVLEGVAWGLQEMVKDGFLRFPPLPPAIQERSVELFYWLEFVRWWWDADANQREEQFDARLRGLGYRGRRDRIRKDVRTLLENHRAAYFKVIESGERLGIFLRWALPGTRNLEDCHYQDLVRRIVHDEHLDNNISVRELTLEQGEKPLVFPDNTHPTPIELLRQSLDSGNHPGFELLADLLETMSQATNGRSPKVPYGVPSDREWVFCLAAMVCARAHGASPSVETMQLLRQIVARFQDTPDLQTRFKSYAGVCEMCLRLPQIKNRMMDKEIFAGEKVFQANDDQLRCMNAATLHGEVGRLLQGPCPSPSSILSSVAIENSPLIQLKEAFLAQLELWSASNRMQRMVAKWTTDTEWVFCLAAVRYLRFLHPTLRLTGQSGLILEHLFETVVQHRDLRREFGACCWMCKRTHDSSSNNMSEVR